MPSARPAQRVLYFDVLRALAIVGVVVLHVAALDWVRADPVSATWQACNVYDSLVRWCVPVFVMLSGALMLDPARLVTFEGLVKKNIARIALVFVVWSAIYLVWDVVQGTVRLTARGLMAAFFTGHYHLWYLQMQAFLYLVTPLLRPIVRERRLAELMICLSIVFCFVPNLAFMSSVVTDVFFIAYNNTNASFICGYVGYFVLGYYLSRAEISKPLRRVLYGGALCALLFTIEGTSWLSVDAGFARDDLYGYLMPNTLLESAALFVAVRYGLGGAESARSADSPLVSAMCGLSSTSLGIYLIHLLVLEGLGVLGISPVLIPAALGVPLLSLVVLLISFLVVRLLRKVKLLRGIV